MTGPLRVLLAGRHYWPHSSIDSANFLHALAVGLHRRGVHVEVVSPRYASSWPEQLVIREIQVHRPAAAPRRDWSINRYQRHLSHWLRDRARSFDVFFADAIREESAAMIEAAKGLPCRTVLRYAGWGRYDDWSWWQRSRGARRCATVARAADAVISKCAISHRTLLSEGFRSPQLHRIEAGFAAGHPRATSRRYEARRVLAATNRDLATEADSIVLVCFGRMSSDSGLNLLVRSAGVLVRRYPNLKIWLLGDGQNRDSMHDQIKADGVRRSVAMPGSFDDWEDIFAAADLYVQTDEDGLESFLGSAVSAELPLVMLDNEVTRAWISGREPGSQLAKEAVANVTWFVPDSDRALRLGVRTVLDDLSVYRRRAATLRRLLVRTRSQSDVLDQYIQLFRRLSAESEPERQRDYDQRPSRPLAGDSSVEAST